MINEVKHIILVLSGKGGVGKSTFSVQLSLSLRKRGYKVGLLDIDLCGPSIPYLLNIETEDVYQGPNGWVPVYMDEEKLFGVMSIGFLLKSRSDSVVWRGPKKSATISQFLMDVDWGCLDYLVIDTPPGTSDEHITVIEKLKQFPSCDGAILVTTPQQVSLEDVRKEYTLCRKTGIPVLGLIENMSGYSCPNCKECTNVFSSDGGRQFAEIVSIPFLGKIPIDSSISQVVDLKNKGIPNPDTTTSQIFSQVIDTLFETRKEI